MSEPQSNPPALVLHHIARSYVDAERTLDVLRGANLAVWPGQTVALIAPSGTGKSTLLHIAGLLERPDQGDVLIGGRPCADLTDAQRTAMRRSEIGFIYQQHRLLPEFTALENGGGDCDPQSGSCGADGSACDVARRAHCRPALRRFFSCSVFLCDRRLAASR